MTTGQLRERVDAQFDETLAVLEDLVRIPSRVGPSAPEGVKRRSAEYVAGLLRGVGVVDVQIVQATDDDGTPGGPAVIGRIPGPAGAPSVLLYAHHDVQPVADDWDTEPFEPVRKDGRLYGRGSADDGAGIAVHVGALKALGESLGVAVSFFIEGEEEVGSPTFGKLLAAHADALRADVVVVADSDNQSTEVPALTTSLRGVANVTVGVRVAGHAVHSGMFGGPLLDAPLLLARLVATLHDADGNVAVPGLASAEHSTMELDESEIREGAGTVPGLRLAGTGSLADRLWHQPAIDLIGFDCTSVAESSNTIIPEATAQLSLRVPPELDARDAQQALIDHLLAQPAFGAEVSVQVGAPGQGFFADTGSPAARHAVAALSEGFGNECQFMGMGGSIPLVNELVAAFPGIQVLITGVEDPDSRAHSGNESMDIELLRKCVLSEALLLNRLAGTAAQPL
jgi:acetylornithine deacetylase/succinyl-diaminopimelate desuccinylase-like protein